jgi:hypothetical protein
MTKQSRISQRTVTLGLRQRAWWVMRKRISFTLGELLSTLADGTERDAAGNLRKYLRALVGAGIVCVEAGRVRSTAITSPGCYRYQLIINAGRKAPVWRAQSNTVYDPNNDTVYPLSIEGEVQDE